MGKITGFLEYTREVPERRPVAERVNDWFEIYGRSPSRSCAARRARCMDCGVPFCHTGCPLTNLIPDWNDLVYRGRWREAVRQLHATNNFPEFTGRICPAPCEASCVLGINEPPVTIKQIEKIHRRPRLSKRARSCPSRPPSSTGKRVAVVGSGPAGLAAAQQLARAGHDVTVFEKNDRIGGLLRYGIPNFKMEKHLIDRRMEQMRAEGVEFETNAHVGGNVPVEDLRKRVRRHPAGRRRRAVRATSTCPAANLKGIHFAMEFLPQQNRRNEGDTVPESRQSWPPASTWSSSAAATPAPIAWAPRIARARRPSLSSNCCPSRPTSARPSTPWPLWPMQLRVESSHEEGGMRDWGVATTGFTGDEHGHVKQLHAVRVGPPPKFEAIAATRVHYRCRPGAAGHGLPRAREERHDRTARRGAGRARQRGRR